MNENPIHKVLTNTKPDRVPIWFMRQAGRYLPEYRLIRSKYKSFREFLFATDDITTVTLQPLNRFDLDAAIIFSDILIVPMLLGAEVDVLENYGPKLSQITDPKDLGNLKRVNIPQFCNPIYEAISKVRAQLDKNKALIGFAGGPWTVASYMIEGKTSKNFGTSKTFAYKWPEAFQILLDEICEVTAEHLVHQIRAGVDVIKIFDSWAGHVPYHNFQDWVTIPHQKIISRVKETFPQIPIISFLKGAEIHYPAYVEKVPTNAIAMGSSADQNYLVRNMPKNIAFQGALDSHLLVAGGEKMVEEIQRQYAFFHQLPYIFNLGHGIVPETPIENVELAIKTIRELEA